MRHLQKLFLLAAILVTCCFAVPAVCQAQTDWDSYEVAASGSCGENASYALYKTGEDTYTFRLYGTGKTGDFITGHNDYLRPWDSAEDIDSKNVTQIVVEEGITYIGSAAFEGFLNPSLTISLPSTLTEIGEEAFAVCGMSELHIPDNVTAIDAYAFHECKNIREVRLPDSLSSLGRGVFCGDEYLQKVTNWNDRLTEIPELLFAATDLIDFEIPDGVTRIGSHAFSQTLLHEVTIPDSVTTIENRAFAYCYNLRSVTMGKNVEGSIAPWCFGECIRLETVVMSDKITSIDWCAFKGCTSLNSVTFSKKLKTIGDHVFEDSGLFAVKLPDSVTTIRASAFKNCKSLVSVTLGSKVKTIKKSAFSGCEKLYTVKVPKKQTARYKKLLKTPLSKLKESKIKTY